PMDYVASMEWVVCLPLCLALATSSRGGWRGALASLAGVATILVVDAQVGNVTSVFTTVALALAACRLAERLFRPDAAWPLSALLGLCSGGLLSLKPTPVVFVVGHFAALVVVDRTAKPGPPIPFRRWRVVPAATMASVLPWVCAHGTVFLGILRGRSLAAPRG